MFDFGWSELIIIGVVALIAIGPKELPTVMRSLAHWVGKIKRMAGEFQGQFQEALRESELADLKKQADEMTGAVTDMASFDPMADDAKDKAATSAAESEDDGALDTLDDADRETFAETAEPEPAPAKAVTDTAADKPAETPAPAAQEELAPAEPPPKQAGGKA